MHNIINNLSIAQALMPQTIQGSALGSGNTDMQGGEALAFVLLVGNIADTLDASHRIDVKIEHADDNGAGAPGSYTACADEDVLGYTGLSSGQFLSIDSAGEKQARYIIGYRGGKRFVKLTATPVSLSTGGPVAILALKGKLNQLPV